MFMREQVVNKKIAMKHLRNLQETPSIQNLIISERFQYWPKFLVSFNKET